MLSQLQIRNLGLIDHAQLELGVGLCVFTGETGVGKSMLLGSLNILAGARAKTDWIRNGEETAAVSGCFILSDPDQLASIREITGLELEEGVLRVERRLRRQGRHRTLLNGSEVPLTMLQAISPYFIEIHGQRAQFSLLKAVRQLGYVDRHAGCTETRQAFTSEFKQCRDLARQIDLMMRSERERNDRRLYLKHLVEELEEAELVVGERDELERELALLEERDQILSSVQGALLEIYDGEESLLDRIGERSRDLAAYRQLSAGIEGFVEATEAALLSLEEGVRALRAVEESLPQDSGRLEKLRARFDHICRLEERYQRSGDELIHYLTELQEEYSALELDVEEVPALESRLRSGLDSLGKKARVLARKRRASAKKLQALVMKELADLGMSDAIFEVQINPLPNSPVNSKSSENSKSSGQQNGDKMINSSTEADDSTPFPGDFDLTPWFGFNEGGADSLEFYFGPNPGEPLRPLREIASGGELSRMTLALKRVLAKVDQVGTLVFDEIDSGVGGRLGTELGSKLRQIGATHQVLCVTHLPQVACFGSRHFHVIKKVTKGRTVSSVEALGQDRREEELAAMLRGSGRTKLSIAEAREMLAEANLSTA